MERRRLELEYTVRNGGLLRRTISEGVHLDVATPLTIDQLRAIDATWGPDGPSPDLCTAVFGPATGATICEWAAEQLANDSEVAVFDDAVDDGLGMARGFALVPRPHVAAVLHWMLEQSEYASACTLGSEPRWIVIDSEDEVAPDGPPTFVAELRVPRA